MSLQFGLKKHGQESETVADATDLFDIILHQPCHSLPRLWKRAHHYSELLSTFQTGRSEALHPNYNRYIFSAPG